MASHSLQAKISAFGGLRGDPSSLPIHRSSPFGYRRRACSPLNRGDRGPFSNGYMIVYGGLKNCSNTIHIPICQLQILFKTLPRRWIGAKERRLTPDNLGKEEQLTSLVQCTRTLAIIRVCLTSLHSSSRTRLLFPCMPRSLIGIRLGGSIERVGSLDRSRRDCLRSGSWGGQESDGCSWECRNWASE